MDQSSRKSRCFGYINFYQAEEAKRCLEEMNNTNIDGRQIVLNHKKSSDFDSNANVLVKNLPESMTQQDLTELFKQHGEIISCKLELGPDNKSRGFGYVQFAKAEDAASAIQKLSGSNVQGKVLNLTVLTKRTDREETIDNFSNLYVSNIPSDWNDARL